MKLSRLRFSISPAIVISFAIGAISMEAHGGQLVRQRPAEFN